MIGAEALGGKRGSCCLQPQVHLSEEDFQVLTLLRSASPSLNLGHISLSANSSSESVHSGDHDPQQDVFASRHLFKAPPHVSAKEPEVSASPDTGS